MAQYKSQDEHVFEHKEFSGLRNNVPEDRWGLEDLSIARNVDIDDSKRVTRRKGYGAVVIAGNYSALWSNGALALAVKDGTELRIINPDYSTRLLRSDLTAGQAMAYSPLADRVYFSNGIETGVVQNGLSRSWGIDLPVGQPDAAAIGGVLPPGRYQYAVTYLRRDGQESGTPRAGLIDLAATGGVRLSAIPVSSDPDITRKVIYFTKNNSDILYRAGVIDNATTGFDFQLEGPMTVAITTQHLRPAPAGQIVGNFNGRMLVAVRNVLYYSEPYSPELFDLRKNYTFAGVITLVAPMKGGVFLGTEEEVVWLSGQTPEQWGMNDALSYGAIAGAVDYCSRDMVLDGQGKGKVVIFATTQGICLGDENGGIVNLTQDRFAYPAQERGAMVIRRYRGMIQALAVLQGAEKAANVAS